MRIWSELDPYSLRFASKQIKKSFANTAHPIHRALRMWAASLSSARMLHCSTNSKYFHFRCRGTWWEREEGSVWRVIENTPRHIGSPRALPLTFLQSSRQHTCMETRTAPIVWKITINARVKSRAYMWRGTGTCWWIQILNLPTGLYFALCNGASRTASRLNGQMHCARILEREVPSAFLPDVSCKLWRTAFSLAQATELHSASPNHRRNIFGLASVTAESQAASLCICHCIVIQLCPCNGGLHSASSWQKMIAFNLARAMKEWHSASYRHSMIVFSLA